MGKVWYDEISIPIEKIWKTGDTFVVTIPKKIMKKHGLKEGTLVHPILLVRRKKNRDER